MERLKIQTAPGHFWTNDLHWFFSMFKLTYHLACMWEPDEED